MLLRISDNIELPALLEFHGGKEGLLRQRGVRGVCQAKAKAIPARDVVAVSP